MSWQHSSSEPASVASNLILLILSAWTQAFWNSYKKATRYAQRVMDLRHAMLVRLHTLRKSDYDVC